MKKISLLVRLFLAIVLVVPFMASAIPVSAVTCQEQCSINEQNDEAECHTYTPDPDDLRDCLDNVEPLFNACSSRCAASSLPSSNVPTGISGSSGTVSLINPLGAGFTDPRLIIGRLIKAILSIIGSITLLMFIYGGVLWITSMGDEKKVIKGKQIIIWATLGLALIAGAYVLVNAIILGLTTGSVIVNGA